MRGAQIVAISLIAIVATGMMIETFNDEIIKLTDLIPNESDIIILTTSHTDQSFTQEQISHLQQFADEHTAVKDMFLELQIQGKIVEPDKNYTIPVNFVDFSNFFPLIDIPNNYNGTSAVVTSDLQYFFPLNSFHDLQIGQSNISSVFQTTTIIDNTIPKVSSGIYLNYSQFTINSYNKAFLHLTRDLYYQDILQELHQVRIFEDLVIYQETAQSQFLLDSTQAIVDTLLLMMTFISILVYFSITNLVSVIIKESKYEIRTLKSVGYSKRQIQIIFIFMSSLIGLIGSLLAIIFSIVLTNLIIAAIVLTTPLSLISLSLDFNIIGLTLLTGTGIATVGSFRPVFREVV